MSMEEFWRCKEYCTGKLSDIAFLEWKYFSFTQGDVEGFICYSIGNPRNVLGLKRGILSYAIYYDGGEEVGQIEIPKKDIDLNGKKRWKFGTTSIENKGNDVWRIKGRSRSFSWDMIFRCVASGKRIHVDLGKNLSIDSWMDWLVFCNSAEVSGHITVEGEKYGLNCLGYYDSNYGHWIPSDNLWLWGHGISRSKEGIVSLSIGESRLDQSIVGHIYLSVGKKVYRFDSKEFDLDYDTSKEIPEKYLVKAKKDDGTALEVEFEVKRTDKLTIKLFKTIPLLNLYLQRGMLHLKFVSPELNTFEISCSGAWEYPKKPKLLSR